MRAIRSALDQTLESIEVVVVVDGRDPATIRAVSETGDERVVVRVPLKRLGNADARNEGISVGRAPWVAFLDDDDEWLPRKLELQLDAAVKAVATNPIVSCRLIA